MYRYNSTEFSGFLIHIPNLLVDKFNLSGWGPIKYILREVETDSFKITILLPGTTAL